MYLGRRALGPRAALAVAAWVVFAAAAGAQEALPVAVSFKFRERDVQDLFDDPGAVERVLSQGLAMKCQDRFPYWTFRAEPVPGAPALTAWLERSAEGADLAWTLRLGLQAGRLGGGSWKATLFSRTDLEVQGGLPEARAWESNLPGWFHDKLLEAHSPSILRALQDHAPLGTEMVPLARAAGLAESRAVLPLDYQKYQGLAGNTQTWFKILCKDGRQQDVTLYSAATGAPSDYPRRPPFPGIVVLHRAWEFAGSRSRLSREDDLASVDKLRTRLFFLCPPPAGFSVEADRQGLALAPD